MKVSRRDFAKAATTVPFVLNAGMNGVLGQDRVEMPANVLFIMCDQMRADAIASLGNAHIYTPNFDRLVKRGISFTQAYSTCPVCVPARYTLRTGCEPHTTGIYANMAPNIVPGQAPNMEDRCGPYLARTMAKAGYRTFGIGKFHTIPWDEEIGFEVQLHSEELYGSPDQRSRDAFAAFIAKEYPAYDFIECLMGERTEMYYMPQMSALPAEVTVEGWASARAVAEIQRQDPRPYFGFVSFIGPHPPLAPPIPFNRMYDPDRMPDPVSGDIRIDHMDEQIPAMNHMIWAEDINAPHARVLKARYYGEISYIDWCLGRILDAVEAREDRDNTLIAFFSDHGDHLGDHHGWQKESFFDASCRVPFLVSWPGRIAPDQRRQDLVCLTDLFGLATGAAGACETRQGIDLLGRIEGRRQGREAVVGTYGVPGTSDFKIMVRDETWKYIYLANGGAEQLFNMQEDPTELTQRSEAEPQAARRLREKAIAALQVPNADRALDAGSLRSFPFQRKPKTRIHQFDQSRGVRGFPKSPEDAIKSWAQT